jgi:nucleotidyltransferase substrate binding protein (TIGR01987 family)
MKLDVSQLEKAITQLEQSLFLYNSDYVQQIPDLKVHLVAAAIQAFEFTYELSWKMLKRYLEMTEPNPDGIDEMSYADLIRTGCEKGLLKSDLIIWKKYREKRSITSHTYNYDKAFEVFKEIPAFLEDAKYLLKVLQVRIAKYDKKI